MHQCCNNGNKNTRACDQNVYFAELGLGPPYSFIRRATDLYGLLWTFMGLIRPKRSFLSFSTQRHILTYIIFLF